VQINTLETRPLDARALIAEHLCRRTAQQVAFPKVIIIVEGHASTLSGDIIYNFKDDDKPIEAPIEKVGVLPSALQNCLTLFFRFLSFICPRISDILT